MREAWEIDVASIEGALPCPMSQLPAGVENLDPGQTVLVLCHHGVRSLAVARWLRQNGFDDAISIAGGIDAWSHEIDTSIPRY